MKSSSLPIFSTCIKVARRKSLICNAWMTKNLLLRNGKEYNVYFSWTLFACIEHHANLIFFLVLYWLIQLCNIVSDIQFSLYTQNYVFNCSLTSNKSGSTEHWHRICWYLLMHFLLVALLFFGTPENWILNRFRFSL